MGSLPKTAQTALQKAVSGYIPKNAQRDRGHGRQNDHGVFDRLGLRRHVSYRSGARASKLGQELGMSRGPTKLFHRFNYFDTAEEELEWVEKNIPR